MIKITKDFVIISIKSEKANNYHEIIESFQVVPSLTFLICSIGQKSEQNQKRTKTQLEAR